MIAELEFSVLYALQALHTPWLDRIMQLITSLGNVGGIWVVSGIILLLFRKTRRMGIAVLLSLLIGFLVGNLFLKPVVARARPCWLNPDVPLLIAVPRDYSFPSGHSMSAFAASLSIYYGNTCWGRAALVLAFLIACSRLYLFVHFPSDVICGILLGIIFAWMVHRGMEWLSGWKNLKEERT